MGEPWRKRVSRLRARRAALSVRLDTFVLNACKRISVPIRCGWPEMVTASGSKDERPRHQSGRSWAGCGVCACVWAMVLRAFVRDFHMGFPVRCMKAGVWDV